MNANWTPKTMIFSVIVILYAAMCCSALPFPGSAELWLGNGTDLSVSDTSFVEGLVVTDNTSTTELIHTMYDPVRNVVYLSAKWAIQQVEWPRGVLTTAAFFKNNTSYGLLLLGRTLYIAWYTRGQIAAMDLASGNAITVFAGFPYLNFYGMEPTRDRSLFVTNCPKIPLGAPCFDSPRHMAESRRVLFVADMGLWAFIRVSLVSEIVSTLLSLNQSRAFCIVAYRGRGFGTLTSWALDGSPYRNAVVGLNLHDGSYGTFLGSMTAAGNSVVKGAERLWYPNAISVSCVRSEMYIAESLRAKIYNFRTRQAAQLVGTSRPDYNGPGPLPSNKFNARVLYSAQLTGPSTVLVTDTDMHRVFAVGLNVSEGAGTCAMSTTPTYRPMVITLTDDVDIPPALNTAASTTALLTSLVQMSSGLTAQGAREILLQRLALCNPAKTPTASITIHPTQWRILIGGDVTSAPYLGAFIANTGIFIGVCALHMAVVAVARFLIPDDWDAVSTCHFPAVSLRVFLYIMPCLMSPLSFLIFNSTTVWIRVLSVVFFVMYTCLYALMCRVVLVTKDFGGVYRSTEQEGNVALRQGGHWSDKKNYKGFCSQYGFLFHSYKGDVDFIQVSWVAVEVLTTWCLTVISGYRATTNEGCLGLNLVSAVVLLVYLGALFYFQAYHTRTDFTCAKVIAMSQFSIMTASVIHHFSGNTFVKLYVIIVCTIVTIVAFFASAFCSLARCIVRCLHGPTQVAAPAANVIDTELDFVSTTVGEEDDHHRHLGPADDTMTVKPNAGTFRIGMEWEDL